MMIVHGFILPCYKSTTRRSEVEKENKEINFDTKKAAKILVDFCIIKFLQSRQLYFTCQCVYCFRCIYYHNETV